MTNAAPRAEPPVVLTSRDAARLRVLMRMDIAHGLKDEVERLRRALERATIVPPDEVPRCVVTMHSRVVYVDVDADRSHEVQLVYPWASEARDGCLSVLDAIGTALLGLSIGATIRPPLSDGRTARIRVVDVPYQPEAAGHEAP